MADLLLNAFIVYLLGLFVVPDLRSGTWIRRVLEVPYYPLVRLGLWHRWSMYAPDVPAETRIALAGVLLEDGSFEVVPLPGLDDGEGFGKARNLRYIAFQWALCAGITDYLKPSLCSRALRLWQRDHVAGAEPRRPVAVEIREYDYPSPEPGERRDAPVPRVRTLWSEPVR